MQVLVLDTYPMVAFFRNEPGSDVVEKLLTDAQQQKNILYMCSYNAGEVFYSIWRKEGKIYATAAWQRLMKFPILFIEPDMQLTYEAATLKATGRLSYADAHAAALSLHLDATLVTGDREFDSLKHIKGFKVKYIH
jgi:predicted nucleic acid-binding protein